MSEVTNHKENSIGNLNQNNKENLNKGVEHVVLVPIRAELHNGNFRNFLESLANQDGRIDVIFLVNGQYEDPESIKQENLETIKLIDSFSDDEKLKSLPEDQQRLVAQVKKNKNLNVKALGPYEHFETNFGLLRLVLFNYALEEYSGKNPYLHMADIDTHYPTGYFKKDTKSEVNISSMDLLLHNIEDDKEFQKFTVEQKRFVLQNIDFLRLQYKLLLSMPLLANSMRFGSPQTSSKLEHFKTVFPDDNRRYIMGSRTGEDHYISQRLLNKEDEYTTSSNGNILTNLRLRGGWAIDEPRTLSDLSEVYGNTDAIILLEIIKFRMFPILEMTNEDFEILNSFKASGLGDCQNLKDLAGSLNLEEQDIEKFYNDLNESLNNDGLEPLAKFMKMFIPHKDHDYKKSYEDFSAFLQSNKDATDFSERLRKYIFEDSLELSKELDSIKSQEDIIPYLANGILEDLRSKNLFEGKEMQNKFNMELEKCIEKEKRNIKRRLNTVKNAENFSKSERRQRLFDLYATPYVQYFPEFKGASKDDLESLAPELFTFDKTHEAIAMQNTVFKIYLEGQTWKKRDK